MKGNTLALVNQRLIETFQFRERYDPNVINDMDEREMLRRRHETAQRITYQAALSQRHSIPLNSDEETSPDDDKLPSRKILPGRRMQHLKFPSPFYTYLINC